MALRMNMNIRSEWEAIDDFSPSPNKTRTGESDSPTGNRLSKSSWKPQISPPRVTGKISSQNSPDQSTQYSQEHTGLAQECIILQPTGPPLPQKLSLPIMSHVSRYTKKISRVRQSTPQEAAQDSNEESSSISASESDKESDSMVTDSSDQDSFETSGDSIQEDFSNDRLLPVDSDTEEGRTRKEQRRQRLQPPAQEIVDQEDTRKHLAYQSPGKMDFINLVSSVQQNSPLQSELALQDSVVLSPYSGAVYAEQLHHQIPVSSSTDPSQDSILRKSADVQVRRSQFSSSNNLAAEKHIAATPLSVASEHIISSGFDRPSTMDRSMMELRTESTIAHRQSSPSQPISPSRKRPRSSLEIDDLPEMSPPKKSKLADGTVTSPMTQHSTKLSPGRPSPYRESSQRPSSSRAIFPTETPSQATHNSMPSTPRVSREATETSQRTARSSQNTPVTSTSRSKPSYHPAAESISFDHKLPQVSASQPNPIRPHVRQQTPNHIENETVLTESQPAGDGQATNPPSEPTPSPPQLDVQAFQNILELRGAEYCTAVKSNTVYGGLLDLFIDFAERHKQYLGSMKHLFTLCHWLITNQGKVDEDYWDDFVLQHQGEYNAYVNRCLLRFKQPGTWDCWYQQCTNQKFSDSVLNVERITRILRGEHGAKFQLDRPTISEAWMRFRRARRSELLRTN